MRTAVADLRSNLMEAGILDPEGVHHEFVSGKHGQKLDFDKIPTGSDLYDQWVQTTAGFIKEEYPRLPGIVIGVANGTNRLAESVAEQLGKDVAGAVSEKDPNNSKKLYLTEEAGRLLTDVHPEFVLVLEDVGTTGSNSVQVAQAVVDAGVPNVEVLTTWQRQTELARLDEADIHYRSMIPEALPTFDPEECVRTGFCARGFEFIPRQD